jgi:glycosyltransferase involved in cell wall biosynthesis
MNILMMTNTYAPFVGGVPMSVEQFAKEFRAMGHNVLVIAPEFENMPEHEHGVLRIPAIRKFNHTDFSVRLPIPSDIVDAIERFAPDIVHSQHPFMMGASALRIASSLNVPVVFTHHTMYERYTHYVPGDSEMLKRIVAEIATGYANLCDQVFAPSESIAQTLRERGVETPINVVPTGVQLERFKEGSGPGFRKVIGIPSNAFLVGHVGRLAPEKNLDFLADTVATYMDSDESAHFLVVGAGPSLDSLKQRFDGPQLRDRLHIPGTLTGRFLVSAYKSMDVFAFSSQTETQGMVLTEAMAASTPVVAVDAPGVRDVLVDGENGFMLACEDKKAFVAALKRYAALDEDELRRMIRAARETAKRFSMRASAEKAIALFERTIERGSAERAEADSPWHTAIERVRTELELFANTASAVGAAAFSPPSTAAGNG